MSNPFEELRGVLAEAEKRVAARLVALEQERDHLRAENESLWSQVHAFQDAKTEPPEAEEDRQG